ncbi:type I restriction enzyme S subunit [Mycoplasmopsis mustelae]|uniref:Type I restriction enzyme S subunit n=1 Tax=Mycoplasmopsis mustelae TaxID=171289 RepID=A0A4R7UE75_9BACT|nr:restriction endonuclease subunit S [Mycoplasmopsis mustelae]TDV24143.1 type I restriction enzyme S subunit [Mycoplasmopsis mustelae]
MQGFVNQKSFFSNGGKAINADKRNSQIIDQYSFGFNPSRINVGSIGYYERVEKGLIGPSYFVFKTKDFVNNHFLYTWFKSKKFNKIVELNKQGSVRENFNIDDLLQITFLMPSKLEQNIIAEIFNTINAYLSLLQRKLDKLKNIKETLLEKMFVSQNQEIPSIRFKEFTDVWKRWSVGDLFDSVGGSSLEKEFNKYGKYYVINIGNYSEEFVYRDQGIRIDLNKKTKEFLLNKGDLAMIMNDKTSEGKIIGSCLYIGENNKFIYNQRTQRLIPKTEIIDNEFSYILLNNFVNRKKVINESQGNTQIYINWSNVINIIHNIPLNKTEQKLIFNFFNNINSYLSLLQRKLDKLKNIKETLLEKMFV